MAQDVVGKKSFDDGNLLLKGATSGVVTLKAPAIAGAIVHTLPDVTATLAGKDVAQSFSKAQRGSQTVLTSSANSVAIDFALNNDFTHTFTENTTLANPTNVVVGQSGSIFLIQHASSPKTLAFGSNWDFIGGTTPVISNTNSARDTLNYIVRSATQIEVVLAKGWA